MVRQAAELSSSHPLNESASTQLLSRLCLPQLARKGVCPDVSNVSTANRTTADHGGNCSALEVSARGSWTQRSQWQSSLRPACPLSLVAGCSLFGRIGRRGRMHDGGGAGSSPTSREAARLAPSATHSDWQAQSLPLPLPLPVLQWQIGDTPGCLRHHPHAPTAACKHATNTVVHVTVATATTTASVPGTSSSSHARRSCFHHSALHAATGNELLGSFLCTG